MASDDIVQYWESELHGLTRDLIEFLILRDSLRGHENIKPRKDCADELMWQADSEQPTTNEPTQNQKSLIELKTTILEPYNRIQLVFTSSPLENAKVFPLVPKIAYQKITELAVMAKGDISRRTQYGEILSDLEGVLYRGTDPSQLGEIRIKFETIIPSDATKARGFPLQPNQITSSLYKKEAKPNMINLLREWICFSYGGLDKTYPNLQNAFVTSGEKLDLAIYEDEIIKELIKRHAPGGSPDRRYIRQDPFLIATTDIRKTLK